ncbi:MAG: ABC transporter ATP-binding protein [Acetobacteraceae bacterium]|nr:ABC transporter ATP-binding protein [Acetobacteraceae bacterium]
MIEVREVTRTFRAQGRQVTALDGVSLRVEPGEVLGVLGPAGSGKTCLVHVMLGLVAPHSGTVTIDGLDVARHPAQALRRVGAVLEGGQGLSGRLTVQENLTCSGYLKGLSGPQLSARISSLLDLLALAEHRHRPAASLSRGAHRRLALAAALVGDPQVLLLDDPTRGLDPQEALDLRRILGELSRDGGRSILICTRHMGTAAELCRKVSVMSRGRLLCCEDASALFRGFGCLPYRLVIRTPSPRVMSRLAGGLETFYPGARLNPDGQTATVIVEASSPGLVYSVLAFLGENDCQLLEVSSDGEDLEERYLELARGVSGHRYTDRLVG